MGKFSGVLIASDFDNTLVFSDDPSRAGQGIPPLSRENREALEYFMAEGGTFSVATGRSMPSFDRVRTDLPMNGPAVLFNGAAIYDYAAHRFLYTSFLPDTLRTDLPELLKAFPLAACQVFHDDDTAHTVQHSPHASKCGRLPDIPEAVTIPISEVPSPMSKVRFAILPEDMPELVAHVRTLSWADRYEIVPSTTFLLEFTAKGATKGGMVVKLAEILHIRPENVYCIGDFTNDVSMLQISHIPFAPANAVPEVLAVSGVHVLPHCKDHAMAAMIAELDRLYP